MPIAIHFSKKDKNSAFVTELFVFSQFRLCKKNWGSVQKCKKATGCPRFVIFLHEVFPGKDKASMQKI
jgi:hypothetical protein